jgi:His/Glu/Gln/Arg/opine family amino acid ABC transporter permease subunit
MATLSDQQPGSLRGTLVNETDTPPRQPPTLLVGPLAWIKRNLFNTIGDSILTIIVTLIVVGSVVSLINWTVTQANWYAVTVNLRLIMLGRYEPEAEWRVNILVILTAFAIGLALAAWARVRRWQFLTVLVLIALTFILPPILTGLLPLPPWYTAAGSVNIGAADGPVPVPEVAFLGRTGEAVAVQVAGQYSGSDEQLAGLHSFADQASNAVLNVAINRLNAQAQAADLTARLQGITLTDGQRARLETELSRITVPDPAVDTLRLNQEPVEVAIINGATGETLTSATLDTTTSPLQVTLPADGWYVLRKEKAADDAVTLLQVNGVFPILERNITRGGADGSPAAGSIAQYVRMSDGYLVELDRPAGADGRELPFTIITQNQYRGSGTFPDYLRLYVAPFFNQINVFFLVSVIVVAIGYFAGRLFDDRMSPPERPRFVSTRFASYLLLALPLLSFVLVYGLGDILPLTDTRRWGGVLLTMLLTLVGIIGSLPLGILLALGRRSKAPVISTVCTIYIEIARGVPFITVLFMAQLLIPLINPSLAEFPAPFRAMIATVLFTAAYNAEVIRGGLQAIPPGQEEAAKAVGLSGLQVTLFITLPQALRLVIPPMMGNFVGMFKDTSLVAIVGLLDVLGMAQNVVAQTEFLGLRREMFLFVVIFYFVISYVMAVISRRIEESGAGAAMSRKI